ncbi:MAG: DUF192 domain-containing protein [Chloroflexota bacterium]
MKIINISNLTNPLSSSLNATYCESFGCKLRGLTFRKSLPMDNGLLLVEKEDSRLSSAIHMAGVFFDLGIVWINNAMQVVDKGLARKWVGLLAPKSPARFTLEIVPGRIEEFNIGDEIRFEK